jgi:hypothetical protein
MVGGDSVEEYVGIEWICFLKTSGNQQPFPKKWRRSFPGHRFEQRVLLFSERIYHFRIRQYIGVESYPHEIFLFDY